MKMVEKASHDSVDGGRVGLDGLGSQESGETPRKTRKPGKLGAGGPWHLSITYPG
jgi:hypothetical protein